MTLEEVVRLVKTALPKGRHQGVKLYLLPRVLTLDELCTMEPWSKFVLADEVIHQLWVAFIDEEPGAAWDHRSRLLLVDDEIAEVLLDLSIHFRPSFFTEMRPLI